MSLDKSLKIAGGLQRHRNVLSRAERINILQDEDRWDESKSVFGLPKVKHRKSAAGHKAKAKQAQAAEAEAPTSEASAEPKEQSFEKSGK